MAKARPGGTRPKPSEGRNARVAARLAKRAWKHRSEAWSKIALPMAFQDLARASVSRGPSPKRLR